MKILTVKKERESLHYKKTINRRWAGVLILLPLISFYSFAFDDTISEKFSRNQNRFEESIAGLNFKFHPDAVDKLKTESGYGDSPVEIQQRLERAERRREILEQKLEKIDTAIKNHFWTDFYFMDFTHIPRLSQKETAKEKIDLPSIEQWFADRHRDWSALGAEVTKNAPDFFKSNSPSRESFHRLVKLSIENLMRQGIFIYLDIAYPSVKYHGEDHAYIKHIKSLNEGTIDKQRYLNELKAQYQALMENRILNRSGASFSSLEKTVFGYIQGEWNEHILPKTNNFFPAAYQNSLSALFDFPLQFSILNKMRENLENLKQSEIPSETHSSMESDRFWFHTPAVSERRYKALTDILQSCYPSFRDLPSFEFLRMALFSDYKKMPDIPGFEFGSRPAVSVGRKDQYAGLALDRLFSLDSSRYNHENSLCKTVALIGRQTLMENERELLEKYLADEGGFYEKGKGLEERIRSLKITAEERKQNVLRLEEELEKERAKNDLYFSQKIQRFFCFSPFCDRSRFGPDQNKIQSLETRLDSERKERDRTAQSAQSAVYEYLIGYAQYSYLGEVFYERALLESEASLKRHHINQSVRLSSLRAELKEERAKDQNIFSWIPYLGADQGKIYSLQDKIKELENKIILQAVVEHNFKAGTHWSRVEERTIERVRESRARLALLESRLSSTRREYEEAEAILASLPKLLEDRREKLENEAVKILSDFFSNLGKKYQEYEKAVAETTELKDSLQKTAAEISELQAFLSEEEPEGKKSPPSPLDRKLLKLKEQIISDLKDGRPPRLEDVFNGLLLEHYRPFKRPFGEDLELFYTARSDLNEIAEAKVLASINFFKPSYEKRIAVTHNNGKPLIYNRSAVSLFDPLLKNRVQCYSGSLLFFTLTELTGMTETPRFAIFTAGHILPGVLSADGKNLLGIETTAKGQGLVNFGPVREISDEIRVVDLYQFLLVDLLKSEISNFSDILIAGQNSLKKYGFSIENLYAISAAEGRERRSGSADILNATPFGFGDSTVPPGDRIRGEVTEIGSPLPEEGTQRSAVKEGGIPSFYTSGEVDFSIGPAKDQPQRKGMQEGGAFSSFYIAAGEETSIALTKGDSELSAPFVFNVLYPKEWNDLTITVDVKRACREKGFKVWQWPLHWEKFMEIVHQSRQDFPDKPLSRLFEIFAAQNLSLYDKSFAEMCEYTPQMEEIPPLQVSDQGFMKLPLAYVPCFKELNDLTTNIKGMRRFCVEPLLYCARQNIRQWPLCVEKFMEMAYQSRQDFPNKPLSRLFEIFAAQNLSFYDKSFFEVCKDTLQMEEIPPLHPLKVYQRLVLQLSGSHSMTHSYSSCF